MNGFLADTVVFIHVLYVAYVVVGQGLIIIAGTFRRQWGRNPWFRVSHIAAIGIVAVEELMGWTCPLTTWERYFRDLAGQPWRADTFMARMAHYLLFSKDANYGWGPEMFTAVHLCFMAIVAQAFLMYPPRMFKSSLFSRRHASSAEVAQLAA